MSSRINKFKLCIAIVILVGFNIIIISKVSDYLYRPQVKYNKLMLVNKENSISEDYIPDNLERIQVRCRPNITKEETYMVKEAAQALEQMFAVAEDEGIYLYASSGYRSYNTQKSIYERNIKASGVKYTNKYVAEPGKSEHQTGLAMDITNESYSLNSNETLEGKWLEENCYKFGFILRYEDGKENITGYNYEPWHFRYVGKREAGKIFNENLTLEEYVKM